jgi:peptidoglycan lytic transglycosylase
MATATVPRASAVMNMRTRYASWRAWCPYAVLATLMVVMLRVGGPAEPPPVPPPRAQLGLASYYGPRFHGRETASGEVFDQTEMVAAHRTLPLGTVVRVTNLDNNRAVVLRVIDRGPYGRNYRRGTIIDVSKGAAQRLRFVKDGLVKVRVDIIEEGDAPDR